MFFISTSESSLVNKRDLQALTLVGPTVTRPVQDPLAVLILDYWLYILLEKVLRLAHPELTLGDYIGPKKFPK